MASITYEWEKLRSSPQAMEVVGDRVGTGLWLSWSVLSKDIMSMLSFFPLLFFPPFELPENTPRVLLRVNSTQVWEGGMRVSSAGWVFMAGVIPLRRAARFPSQ